MKLIVLGTGLMGPAAAFWLLAAQDVTEVTVCDADRDALTGCMTRLARVPGAHKLQPRQVDLTDRAATADLLQGAQAALSALPWRVSRVVFRAAADAGVPVVDLALPVAEELPELARLAARGDVLLVPGGGLEPGLTEILARYLAEQMDTVSEVHIKCGGVPAVPEPPLGYKLVFGGRRLPLYETNALEVADGTLQPVARYSDVETVRFDGLGDLEAWHEGFMPNLLEVPALQGLRRGTQKTIRWPGYAARATVLKELGLLSLRAVDVDGIPVVPKHLVDTVLYPQVRMTAGDRDITLLRVEVLGSKGGRAYRARADMVDRYDDRNDFTSMARTTAFTGAAITLMIARGEIARRGLHMPEQVVAGSRVPALLQALESAQIHIDLQVDPVSVG